MKKQQIVLIGAGIFILVCVLLFGKIIPNKTSLEKPTATNKQTSDSTDIWYILKKSEQSLNPSQFSTLSFLNEKLKNAPSTTERKTVYKQLVHFWGDSLSQPEIAIYYATQVAKLENSEKSLTFAAHLLLDGVIEASNQGVKNWAGKEAKELFEQLLRIRPTNDSAKVGLGACYLFGYISDNPMAGVTIIRKVLETNPDNVYAHYMLGFAGIKSGQYDKAIEHFAVVVKTQSDDANVVLNLAECYERTGDKVNAVKYYKSAKNIVEVPDIGTEIDKRIKILQ